MKKALSVLLVAAVILGLAAPLAFANEPANIVGTLNPAAATVYVEPDPDDASQKNYVDVELPAHTCRPESPATCSNPCRFYWDTVETFGMSPLTFRPERYLLAPALPLDNNLTYGTEKMRLETFVDSRIEFPVDPVTGEKKALVVEYYAECQCCKQSWTITVTIEPPAEIVVHPMGLFEILASWWFDLKWTWDYQIHPFFKYIYFNACGWFVSAWDMLIKSISTLFTTLFDSLFG